MIINHKRKFVFVCVPKTGSTTLSKHFIKIDNLPIERSWLKDKWHWPMFQIQKHYKLPLKDFYTFAYHRNPWDRMISSWIEFTNDHGHLITWSQALKDQYKTFEDFILNFRSSEWTNEIHFRPTCYYTHLDGKQMVNHIARYENWQSETKNILETIDLDINDMEGKRYRKTKRDSDYRKYYTNDKMIEAVENHFKIDIDKFGDKF